MTKVVGIELFIINSGGEPMAVVSELLNAIIVFSTVKYKNEFSHPPLYFITVGSIVGAVTMLLTLKFDSLKSSLSIETIHIRLYILT